MGDSAHARRRALVVPREHGAWGLLLIPLATGAAVGLGHGGRPEGLAPLVLTILSLFWLRTPVESWAGTSTTKARTAEEIRLARRASLWIGAVAAGSAAWLLWGGERRGLVWIGAAAAAAFLAQWALKQAGRRTRSASQMVGAAGLTSTAIAAYYVTTGRVDETAWAIWAANFLFAGNQIHFVWLRIHAAQAPDRVAAGRWFLVGQVAMAIGVAAGLAMGWYAAVAFTPGLARGFAWFVGKRRPLDVHALGKSELAHGLVFGGLLVAAMLY